MRLSTSSLALAAILSSSLVTGSQSHENAIQRRAASGIHADALPHEGRMQKKLKSSRRDGGLLGGLLGGGSDDASTTASAAGGTQTGASSGSGGLGGLLGGLLGSGPSSDQSNNTHAAGAGAEGAAAPVASSSTQGGTQNGGLLGGLLGDGDSPTGTAQAPAQTSSDGGLLGSVVSGLLGDGGSVASGVASSVGSLLSGSGSAIGVPTGTVGSVDTSSLMINPSATSVANATSATGADQASKTKGRGTSTVVVTAGPTGESQLNSGAVAVMSRSAQAAIVAVVGGAAIGGLLF